MSFFIFVNDKLILLVITLRRDVYDTREIEIFWKLLQLENLKMYSEQLKKILISIKKLLIVRRRGRSFP